MKRLFIFFIVLIPLFASAQKQTFEQYKAEKQALYQKYKSAKQKQHDAYRQKINAEHAAYMQKKWTAYKSYAAKRKPKDQDPPAPVVKKHGEPKGTNEIRYKLVVKLVPYEVPDPVVPIDEPPAEDKAKFKFMFHGTQCAVHLNDALKFKLSDASEQAASSMWRHLSDPVYDGVVADCLRLRKELQLADWGYINLLQAMTNSFFGANSNEAILMQMYILTQSGYTVRIAQANKRFVLLVPFDADLYGYSYFRLDGKDYYILDKEKGSQSYTIFNKAFPKEQVPSLRMTESPKLAYSAAPSRTLSSRRWPSLRASVSENKNLISFYNEYPLSASWDYYSNASLSNEATQALYPVLKREISGKSKYEAANMLINFVQTAFDYKTDGDQFGYERPLFGDETLYYPYSDCEDRSILYSILVRELLDLDVVLLEYPGHLATAVAFPNNQSYGYHFTYNNKVYTICDPTYINADAGDCMPEFRSTAPEVIIIK